MRFQILGVAAIAYVTLLAGCGSDANPSNTPPPSGAGAPGAAGAPAGMAGSPGSAGTPVAAGGSSAGGAPGTAGAPAAAGAAGTDTGMAGNGNAGAPATGNYGGVVGLEDLSTVKMSPGCNKDAAADYPGITMDNKWNPKDNHDYKSGYIIKVQAPADHPVAFVAGKLLDRRYFIKLPAGYDKTKPYKVLFQGAGCTGKGTDVTDFSTVTNNKAIMIALEIFPGVWGGGSATPDGGSNGGTGTNCFDDKRGEKTIEKGFIEGLYEKLRNEFCFDEHRVFIAGHSSGGWLSNQFGNAYGSKIFRAISPSSGGLALGTQQQPTDNLPVPGIWWHQPMDGTNPFQGTKDALAHALVVNKCTNTTFDGPTEAATYPNVTICKKYTTCPKEFPITLCQPSGSDHSNNHDVMNNRAATWTFFDAF